MLGSERSEDAAENKQLSDDGDSETEVHDGDAAAMKELKRHTDMQEYEGEEEEREEVGDATQPDSMEGGSDLCVCVCMCVCVCV